MCSVDTPRRHPLLDLAALFTKLGFTALGGPAVHIAMMEDEVVARRGWLTRSDFLDFLGAANLIPGPTSTEMAIHIGQVHGGWLGLLVAGWSFILPSTFIVLALAWAYTRYGTAPQLTWVLYGVKPVVIAVIAQAILKLGKSAVKSVWLAVLGAAAVVMAAAGVQGLTVLAAGGTLAALAAMAAAQRPSHGLILGATASAQAGAAAGSSFSLLTLFLTFLKIGATLFGGGYVLVALIRSDLVERLQWISERQLLDAIAAGQVTPGPLSTTATFIGYVIGGVPGALLATVAMFLPAFLLVAVSGPVVRKIRQSRVAGAALDGVNVSALALMLVVNWQLGHTAIVDWTTGALAVVSTVLLVRYRVSSFWLTLGGAVAGSIAGVWRA
jgi:chromate transporter